MSSRLLVLLLVLSAPAQAGLYKWVDEKGNVQYSDKPPAQPGKSGTAKLDSQGMMVSHIDPPLTAEQSAARDADAAHQREEQARKESVKRHDNALLNSFSNTKEIDDIRDSKLDQIRAGIASDQSRIDAIQKRVDEDNKRMDKIKQSKQPVPSDMVAQATARHADIAKIRDQIQQKQTTMQQVRTDADADKKRLIELRAGPSPVAAH